jgi:hypothetical protein
MIDQCRGGTLAVKGVEAGLTSIDDVNEMANDWARWAAGEDSSLSMLHGETLIEK